MSSKFFLGLAIASAALLCSSASADVLSTTGSVSVSNSGVDFYPLGGGSGTFNIGPPNTGVFAGLTGSSGLILDLNSLPINTTINLPDFMTFNVAPNLSITLTEILGGTLPTCAPAAAMAGQGCSPAGTPYNLINQSATSSTASASVEANLIDSNTGKVTPLLGVFTSQFVNMNYQQLVAAIESGQSVDSTYSAQFVTNFSQTPEPGTFALLAGGLFLACLPRLRKELSRARAAVK